MEPYSQIVVEVRPGETFGVETGVFYPAKVTQVELVYGNQDQAFEEFSIAASVPPPGNQSSFQIVGSVPEGQAPGRYFCRRMLITTQEGNQVEVQDVPQDTMGLRVLDKPDKASANGWRVFKPS